MENRISLPKLFRTVGIQKTEKIRQIELYVPITGAPPLVINYEQHSKSAAAIFGKLSPLQKLKPLHCLNPVRVAIIDCGTNTFNLLIADLNQSGPAIIHTGKIPVKIGKGGINKSVILPDAMDRAVNALIKHADTVKSFGVEKSFVFATSAIRNATNREEFKDRVMRKTGFEITVISGEREAELIYEGVKNSGSLTDETCMIMDIGGGSSEFILCNKYEAFERFSFEIGVSRLIDKFRPDDPITESQVTEIYRYLDETLAEMFEKTLPLKPRFLVGSSGTFDTFADILKAEKKLPQDHSTSLSYSVSDFNRLYHKILMSNMEERLAIPGMAAFRAEMITASVISVKCVIDRYEFSQIKSSAYSMKEGILFSIYEGKI